MIPRNARNIRVEEVTGVDNYLALQNDNGEYYLNGHWFIQWSGDYNIAGTVVRYNRLGNRDSFDAAGPITEPLHIMVVRLPLLNFTQFLLISGHMLFLLTWIYFLTLIFFCFSFWCKPGILALSLSTRCQKKMQQTQDPASSHGRIWIGLIAHPLVAQVY